MELEHIQKIALIGFFGATIFGAIASRTQFCTMGAISDWINMGSLTRFRVWFLAMGLALVVTQILYLTGSIDLGESIYHTTSFTWLGYIFGGLLFGIGMTIASGCGQRTVVRLGGGNLKSLIVLLVMGLTAYMTLRGILSIPRLFINDPTTWQFSDAGLASQGLHDILSRFTGLSPSNIAVILTVIIGGAAVVFAFLDRQVWSRFDNLLAGIGIGLLIAGAWYTTGVIGYDDFDPIQLEGVSFISPVGNTISYLMTFTGATINFGIAIVLGTLFGSFIYSLITGNFRIESFSDTSDLVNHIIGAILMGFGGVLALGCTIGQGITGMSTLALSSIFSLGSIILGCIFTLKVQYNLLDDLGFWKAVKVTSLEMLGRKSSDE
ncbi:MAG: YeeE/YedE family protein [Gammaproteobacteria bacterium]|nr:YeeE/YedE family protein [Gammaproteobacteria bacterium]MCY4219553.1 YeeE/YedE family protein [Gammaproteobacteria bacterium]MCY4275458.1 YeeE/YedE family protein [Gammaproteobacteria bacterium]